MTDQQPNGEVCTLCGGALDGGWHFCHNTFKDDVRWVFKNCSIYEPPPVRWWQVRRRYRVWRDERLFRRLGVIP